MKSSAFVFLFMTACGPAFHSDLFGEEQDAATILESKTDGQGPLSGHPEASADNEVVADAGSSIVLGDATDALVEAHVVDGRIIFKKRS